MQVSRFVVPADLRVLVTYLRAPVRLLGLSLLAPVLVALVYREVRSALVFSALAILCYALGRTRQPTGVTEPSTRDALVVAASVYLLFGLVGALAFWPSVGFVDGFFESMSGFTTTGLSVVDIGTLPRSLVFFRSYSQWIGGAGIVVLSIAFLTAPRAALVHLYTAEFKEENLLGNIVATTRLVLEIYGGLTLLAGVAYWLAGMDGFDALLHALSTISTGGFSPHASSIGEDSTVTTKLVVCLFMITGATAFPLYYRAHRKGMKTFFGDGQLRALLVLVALGLVLAIVFSRARDGVSIVDALFHTVSAVTTTGFNVTDSDSWPEGLRMVSTILMFIGGSAGSTAGGLKLFRLLILIAVTRWYVTRALLPQEAHLAVRIGDRVLREDDIRAVTGLVALYLGIVGLSTVLLTIADFAPSAALFESASALGTVGLSVGVTSASLPLWAKGVLIFDMWAGRLEILPLLIWFYPPSWRRFGGRE